MSDYLGRLAARVMTPARLIRPRTQSIFEPPAAEAEAPVEWAPARSATVVREERVATREPRVEPPVTPIPPRSPKEVPERQFSVDARQPEQETEPPASSPPPNVIRETIERPPVTVTRTIEGPSVTREIVERRPERIVRERRVAERIERLRVRRERTVIEQNNLITEAPIEVTIGRIDVRAVVAPPQPSAPRATAAAPAMSLKDYLSERGARRR